MPVSLASFLGATLWVEELVAVKLSLCELLPPMPAITSTTMMTQNHHFFQKGFLGFCWYALGCLCDCWVSCGA